MSKSEYSDVIVLGAGLAGHVCAAALPGSTLVGKPGSLPVYNVELYDPLATFLGFEPDHEVTGRVWVHHGREESVVEGPWSGYWKSYPAPLQSAPGYRFGGLLRLHRSVPDASYADANERVWGAKTATQLNAYNDKKLGVDHVDPRPSHDIWRPPDRKERLRTILGSKPIKRASVPVADFLAAAVVGARREGVSFVQRDALQVEVMAGGGGRGPLRVWVAARPEVGGIGEFYDCKMLVNTVPFPVFGQIRKGGNDYLGFAARHLRRSGLRIVEVTGSEVSCDYDTFLSPELDTQRVTHHGNKHIVEIPRRHEPTVSVPTIVNRMVCEAEVQELGRLGVFGGTYSMAEPVSVPNGYPFVFQEQAGEWESIKQQDRELGIHHVGRWAAWDQSYTSHVYTKIEELKKRWCEHA